MTTSRSLQVTCVVSAKGGIGQSMLCLDWARVLGRSGQRALLLELAGGDLAWHVGAAPEHCAGDVARGAASLADAVVEVEDSVGLLASGNQWSVFGPEGAAHVDILLDRIGGAGWQHLVVDVGNASRAVTEHMLVRACRRVILLADDIACVARTYALLRMLGSTVLSENTSLVFNRIDNCTDAESLQTRFSQLTSRFLNRTWPVLGTVPNGASEYRLQTIASWGQADVPEPQLEVASIQGGISNRPFEADN